MMQDGVTQRRVVIRGAMDTCCSLWTPILPPTDVLKPIAILDRVDSGDARVEAADSDSPESKKK